MSSPVQYIVPQGTSVLVHKMIVRTKYADPRDFEMIVSTKEVHYVDEEVVLNPNNHWCSLEPLRGSLFHRDHNYWGFRLPKNDRGAPYILVVHDQVKVLAETARSLELDKEAEFNKNLLEFIDQYKKDVMTGLAKQVDDEIMKNAPSLFDVDTAKGEDFSTLVKMDPKRFSNLLNKKGIIIP